MARSSMLPSFPLPRPHFGSEWSSAAVRCFVIHALCYLVAMGVTMTCLLAVLAGRQSKELRWPCHVSSAGCSVDHVYDGR
jgi:hypothetical protein